MIQSCGMTSAAFTIIWMKIQIEWHAIILSSLGATFGIIFGLQFVDDLLTGPEKKMLFVSIWFSFALSLFLLNTQKKRTTYEKVQEFCFWKGVVLFGIGIIGGLCSAFAGSGVDICAFSMLTLLFRISEKVATPTSVILMAVNTCVGFFWRQEYNTL
uniref:Membrane transporter protein n=1 Tax=Acrobeloides nanus TaxID=290746 RepID=A0A914D2A3_9BILA